jgi:hypothetical protein
MDEPQVFVVCGWPATFVVDVGADVIEELVHEGA